MCRHRSLLLALLLAPALAQAETIDATSVTLLSGRQDPRDGNVHTVVPLIESLAVRAEDLKLPGFQDARIVLSAWGEVDPGDPRDGEHGTGDVDLAFAEGRLFQRRMTLRLGRQLLFAGAARNLQLDGLSVRTRIGGGVGIIDRGGGASQLRLRVPSSGLQKLRCWPVLPSAYVYCEAFFLRFCGRILHAHSDPNAVSARWCWPSPRAVRRPRPFTGPSWRA